MTRRVVLLTLPASAVLTAALVSGQAADGDSDDAAAALKRDSAAVQGVWERYERAGFFSRRRIVKKIEGTKESITTYDKDANVVEVHTVDVQLRRAGPVRIFTYTNQTFTAGPNKGRTNSQGGAYVYRVSPVAFTEVWGLLEGEGRSAIRVLEWSRVKGN